MDKELLEKYRNAAKAYRKAEQDMRDAAKKLTNDLFKDRWSSRDIANRTGWSKTMVICVGSGFHLGSADYLEALISFAEDVLTNKQEVRKSLKAKAKS
jgi:hypothetical protein